MTLLHQLQRQDFTLVTIDDGMKLHRVDPALSSARQRAAAAEVITAVDQAILSVRKDDKSGWLLLVLGNDADEIPADWSTRLPLASSLDAAVNAYQAIWEGKPVPTKPENNR